MKIDEQWEWWTLCAIKMKARTGGEKGWHLLPRLVQKTAEVKTSYKLSWKVNKKSLLPPVLFHFISFLFVWPPPDPSNPYSLLFKLRSFIYVCQLLTRLGRKMAEFPLEPQLSKMLITRLVRDAYVWCSLDWISCRKWRYIEISKLHRTSIARVFPSTPWHPGIVHADHEWFLSTYPTNIEIVSILFFVYRYRIPVTSKYSIPYHTTPHHPNPPSSPHVWALSFDAWSKSWLWWPCYHWKTRSAPCHNIT